MALIQPETLISLLAIPDHLRQTLIIVQAKGSVTANDVSQETKRARAVESAYLNQLVTMGFASKRRCNRRVFFQSATSKTKQEVQWLWMKLKNMPREIRDMICDDMMTAFENRIKVVANLRNYN